MSILFFSLTVLHCYFKFHSTFLFLLFYILLTSIVTYSIILLNMGILYCKRGPSKMKKLCATKLAEIIKAKREEKGLSKEQLGDLTGINRIMIGRIERQNFIPSITQMEALSNILEFDITDVFVEKQETNSFIALRSEALSKSEREGVDKLFKMMITLRKQILLRSKYENESLSHS